MKNLFVILMMAAPLQAETFEAQLHEVRSAAMLPGQDHQRKSKLMQIAADPAQPVAKRVDALKELRTWAPGDTAVAAILEGLSRDSDEPMPVRLRSAKSMGMAITLPSSQYKDMLSVLLGLSRDEGNPVALRAMTIKALHWANESQEWVKTEMLGWAAAGQPAEIREAALWALASAKPAADKELLAVLGNRSESPKLRLQALKSLYPMAANAAIRGVVTALAQDASESGELRETAGKFLLEASARPDLWIFFRLRHEPVTYKLIEVLEYE